MDVSNKVLRLLLYEIDTRRELETVGLRLNKRPPNIYFKKKKEGGIKFNATVSLTKASCSSIHPSGGFIRQDVNVVIQSL